VGSNKKKTLSEPFFKLISSFLLRALSYLIKENGLKKAGIIALQPLQKAEASSLRGD